MCGYQVYTPVNSVQKLLLHQGSFTITCSINACNILPILHTFQYFIYSSPPGFSVSTECLRLRVMEGGGTNKSMKSLTLKQDTGWGRREQESGRVRPHNSPGRGSGHPGDDWGCVDETGCPSSII